MKYRIVQYKNGEYGLQHKIMFTWWDEIVMTEYGYPFVKRFDSTEKAEEYLAYKLKKKFTVVKEL